MNFSLEEIEYLKVIDFVRNHDCSIQKDEHGFPKIGVIGGSTSYIFTPTSLGMIIEVECSCGKKENVTDYGLW